MKICYFGIYNPKLGRNKIYIKGFKENGVEIIECKDNSPGPLKFVKLFFKHKKVEKDYDFMVVGYPGHMIVWLAKLVSKKPVIFDALCTMYEGVVISRGQFGIFGIKSLYIKLIDWLAVKCADIILVESENQRIYFEERFGRSKKYKVVYTGADDSVYYIDPNIKKTEKFTAIFRGRFLPEAGIKYCLRAAKILEKDNVNFLLIGSGWLGKEIKEEIIALDLKNIELISDWLSDDEIRENMLKCHVSLGQFENNERLSRTIPHKCFETLALGLPYITACVPAVSEILKDGKDCLMVDQANPRDLVKKILMLKNNSNLKDEIGRNGRNLFENKFTPKILVGNILFFLHGR